MLVIGKRTLPSAEVDAASDAREALRAAVAAAKTASAAVKSAQEVGSAARDFVRSLESEAAGHSDLAARVASERADAIKVALAAGSTPTFELSERLAASVVARAELDNKLTAAREASAALAQQHADAVIAEGAANRALSAAIAAVVRDEADILAEELAAADLHAMSTRVKLLSLADLRFSDGQGGVRQPSISQGALKALHADLRKDLGAAHTPTWRLEQAANARARAWAVELAGDAAVEFGR